VNTAIGGSLWLDAAVVCATEICWGPLGCPGRLLALCGLLVLCSLLVLLLGRLLVLLLRLLRFALPLTLLFVLCVGRSSSS